MLEFFANLFQSDFMPHGHCYFWRPEIVWLHVISDAIIAISYYVIPIALVYFVRKRRDLQFHWMFILFGVFILACGTTHVMSIWTLWHGTYRLDGLIKAITAVASISTATLLVPLIPRALAIPSPEQLRIANALLATEIVERRRIEAELAERNAALERSNAELQQFASVASHDLQEPLRKIQAFSDLLENECATALTGPGKDYLERILAAVGRMRTLIDDLLKYARITSRARTFQRVDLRNTVRGVLSDLETSVEATGTKIVVGELPAIEADATQMTQVFQNLIANGIKFRDGSRTPVIKIGLISNGNTPGNPAPPRDPKAYTIAVEDNGIGFEERYLDRIFVMFQRLHGRSEYPGNGIGLSICRKILERHGGSITARSEPGHGSTFFVVLPVTQPVPEDKSCIEADGPSPS